MSVNIKDKITTSTFLQLLKVQIISTIVSLVGTMIDGVIISRFLGPINMSAYGIGNPVVIVMVAFAFVLSAGSQALCGQHMGRGEINEVNRIMNKVIFCGFLIGVLFNIVIFAFSPTIATLLGAEGEIHTACSAYLRGFSFAATGLILSPILISFMQMDRDGSRAMLSSVVLIICCTTLDLLNVFVFNLGMLGMGLTTAFSYFFAVLVLFLHFAKKERSLNLSIKSFGLKGVGPVIKTGFPAATYHVTNFVKVLSTNLIVIAVGGTAGIFSCTVLNSINNILVGFINGIGLTTLLMCSVIVGEGNRRSLHHTLRFIFKVGIIMGLSLFVALFFLSEWCIADFYCTGDSVVYRDVVVTMFRIYGICVPLAIMNSIFINYFQSMKRLALANIICVLDNAVYLISCMLVISGIIGLNGVWIAFTCSEFLSLVTIVVIAFVKTKRIPTGVHDLMLLPDTFGVDAGHRLNLTIKAKNEIADIHNQIADFCQNLGVDSKKAIAAGHCMEELAGVAFENRKKKKKTYVDIYLTYVDSELRLRMRDNGVPIDVSMLNTQDEPFDLENIEDNLGLRIVLGMAKDVNYSVVLGLNVFALTL